MIKNSISTIAAIALVTGSAYAENSNLNQEEGSDKYKTLFQMTRDQFEIQDPYRIAPSANSINSRFGLVNFGYFSEFSFVDSKGDSISVQAITYKVRKLNGYGTAWLDGLVLSSKDNDTTIWDYLPDGMDSTPESDQTEDVIQIGASQHYFPNMDEKQKVAIQDLEDEIVDAAISYLKSHRSN